GVVVGHDVGPEGAGGIHRGAADGAGEQPEERHGGSDRQGGIVPDAAIAGGGVEDHGDQDQGQDDLHDERSPFAARRGDRVVAAGGDVPVHDLQEQGGGDRPG